MAAKQQAVDAKVFPDYVKHQIAELTSRTNIDAMLKSDAKSEGAKAIEDAGSKLINPLVLATQSDNAVFRSEFAKALIAVAPEVMKNHLFARTQLIMALSRAQDPVALPVLISQIQDPKQPASIKLLAAVGLTNLARGGRWSEANPAEAMKAAQAVAVFLRDEPETFWPVQVKILQALGDLRQASADLQQPKGEFAAAALKVLADPKTNLAARAWAAWRWA